MGFQEFVGMQIIECSVDYVQIRLDIKDEIKQPYGYLHGGVSAALAEHAASLGASQSLLKGQIAFGMELNVNHLKSKRSGTITTKAWAVHKGKQSQVWSIKIVDEEDNLICIGRCTIAIKGSI